MVARLCVCTTPDPYRDNFGKETNRCKSCGGQILHSLDSSREMGSLIIVLEGAIRDVALDEQEVGELCVLLRRSIKSWVKNTYQAWKYEQAYQAGKAK